MNTTDIKSLLKNKKFYLWFLIFAGIILAIVLNLSRVTDFIGWLYNAFFAIILGCCIAFVLNILTDFFTNKVFKWIRHNGIKTGLSIVLSLLVVIIIAITVIVIVVPQLLESFRLLAQHLPTALESLRVNLEKITQNYPALREGLVNLKTSSTSLSSSISNFFKEVLPNTLNKTYSFAMNSFHGVTTVLIALLFALYLLIFKGSLHKSSIKFCYALFSEKTANRILYIFHLLYDYFKAFIYGRVGSAICLAILYCIPALLFRIPYTLMMTTIFAVFSIIPLFGALVSWIIGLFLIATQSMLSAVIFTVIFVVDLLLVRNVIYPRLIGKSIGLPDFWVLFAVIIGGKLFGIVGMLTAVPIFALIYTLIDEKVQKNLKEKSSESNRFNSLPNWENYNPETDSFNK